MDSGGRGVPPRARARDRWPAGRIATGRGAAGLPTAICPECGGDLDVVGVVRVGHWSTRLRRQLVRIGLWTAALLLAVGLFHVVEDELPLPRVTVRQRFVSVFPGDYGQGFFATASMSQT